AALAAALGDDLNAALDRQASSFWGGGEAEAPAWPKGVKPLASAVRAPAELAARLAFTGLVAREDGDRLQTALKPGMRLVSREARAQSLDETIARFEAERGEAEAALERAKGDAEALPATGDLGPQLEDARTAAAAAREAASKARADLDQERREREGRAQRLET